MDKEQILQAIQKQKEYLPNSEFRYYKNRVKALKKLRENIKVLESEITLALKKDLNKSEDESYMCEIGMVMSELSYMIRHCKRLSKPKRVGSPIALFPAKSYKLPCPYGLVLIISPWNYPFMLSLDPLIDAVAAGNSVVLKPSASSPNVSAVIHKLIKMTFKPEQVFVVLGSRENSGFLLDQKFDYIFFTGSKNVGKTIMEKASENLTPVTLEMGGKSPVIVDETSNIPLTAKRIIFGKLLNCGQTCVAPDFVYCAKSVKERLIQELKKQIILQYSVDPIRNENYPKMINERQFNKVSALINQDKVLFGGKTNKSLLKIEPTIIDATFTDEIMQQEIFGPLLPIVTFESLDEAINELRLLPSPLALYIFSSKKKNQDLVISSLDFGGGCINDTIMHIATTNLGFGGFKESGLGAYHGKIGFDTFSHTKSIVNRKTWLDMPIRYQPFTKIKHILMRLFLK